MRRYNTWHSECKDGEMVEYREAMKIIVGLEEKVEFLENVLDMDSKDKEDIPEDKAQGVFF